MNRHDSSLTINLAGNLTPVQIGGEPHYEAPVVILTEGVHVGSQGPHYYPPDEIAASAQHWNNIVVTANHPVSGYDFVSAKDPRVNEQFGIGYLKDIRYEARPQPRLRGKVVLNLRKIQQKAPFIQQLLTAGNAEVSTGLFSNDEAVHGVWNSEPYQSIVRDIRPDHLAILTESKGACSWADGCGIRANQNQGGNTAMTNNEEPLELPQTFNATKQEAARLVGNSGEEAPLELPVTFGEVNRG
ncbi:MAG: DUF2213 domain-containing protein [Dehalococcoidia bacterium]|nr:MAG: DUF2213 domain-containing protein [Dehalococcoidia bacterium]